MASGSTLKSIRTPRRAAEEAARLEEFETTEDEVAINHARRAPPGSGAHELTIETEPTFRPGNPEVLFVAPSSYRFAGTDRGRAFDLSPDGERFLMIDDVAGSSSESPVLALVQHWTQELLERVPPQ